MTIAFSPYAVPKSTAANTVIFAAMDAVAGEVSATLDVKLSGSGLTWNSSTDQISGGTVETLTLQQAGVAFHTVTLDTSTASTRTASFNAYVNDAALIMNLASSLSGFAYDHVGTLENWVNNTATGDTSVDVPILNSAGILAGYYRLAGTGILETGSPATAKVNFLKVLNTAKTQVSQIDYSSAPVSLDKFEFIFDLDVSALAMHLMAGADTVVSSYNDAADGILGDDAMDAGLGADIYNGSSSVSDTVSYASAKGAVTVRINDGATAGTALGGGGDDTLFYIDNLVGSHFGSDSLTGNSSGNFLDGGADNQHDSLIGGAGNDTYYLRDGNYAAGTQDGVAENIGGGVDLVISDATRDLQNVSFNVENLTLSQGSAALNGYGNSLDNVLTGNALGNILDGRTGADTLVGGAGNDTYVVDTYIVNTAGAVTSRDTINEISGEGSDTVRVRASFALEDNDDIEILETYDAAQMDGFSLTGSAIVNDIRGNAGANRLDGGNDSLVDTLQGGRGNDTYVLGAGNDTVTEAAEAIAGGVSQGVDSIETTISRALSSFTGIENIILVGTSNIDATGSDSQTGVQANNKFTGNSGNNKFSGLAGNDTYIGGLGNDTFVWDGKGADKVEDYKFETGNFDKIDVSGLGIGDFDTLKALASVSTTSAGVKSTLFKTTVAGTAQNMSVSGMDFAAIVTAVTAGTLATDYFVFDTSVSVTPKYGTDAKSDYIYGGGGADFLYGYDNNGATTDTAVMDYLYGESGNDTLDGGLGGDRMYGGSGNDTYVVDNGSDIVVETSAGGTLDTIQTKMSSYSLATTANQYVERLYVHSSVASTVTVTLTGNDSANTLSGHAGNNILKGGKGVDSYVGSNGNDIYYIDAAETISSETSTSGDNDQVMTTVSYTLAATARIEYIAAISGFTAAGAVVSSTAAINLTGNGFTQTLVGNSGVNTIDGNGGNDILTGGGGNDYFNFTTAPVTATNNDTITDFNAFYDTIRLDNAAGVFQGLGSALGTLSANKFYVGSKAHDLDDRIIYNKTTGELHYDANGSAAGGDIVFAVLKGKPTITNADFVVI